MKWASDGFCFHVMCGSPIRGAAFPPPRKKKNKGHRINISGHVVKFLVLWPYIPCSHHNTQVLMIVERHEIATILVFLCVYIDIAVMCMYKRGSQNSGMFLWLYKVLQIHVLNVSSPSTQPYHGLCLLAASGGSGWVDA